jgi:hypothetical protein
MAVRQTGRKTYRTMQGKQIDMDMLRQRNELTPAVGNARVNARGDELGAGGKISRKREDILRDYYADNPAAAPDEVITREQRKAEETPAPKTRAQKKAAQIAKEQEQADAQDEWVEDEDGNFVKRGE